MMVKPLERESTGCIMRYYILTSLHFSFWNLWSSVFPLELNETTELNWHNHHKLKECTCKSFQFEQKYGKPTFQLLAWKNYSLRKQIIKCNQKENCSRFCGNLLLYKKQWSNKYNTKEKAKLLAQEKIWTETKLSMGLLKNSADNFLHTSRFHFQS